jgi:hypothetical protein
MAKVNLISKMDKPTEYWDSLYRGYKETGSMFGALSDGPISSEERVKAQPQKLTELAAVASRAERVRLYGLDDGVDRLGQAGVSQYLTAVQGGHDLEFSPDPRLMDFLADARRTMAQVRGETTFPPAYDDLLCFFSTWEDVSFSWCEHATLRYLVNPKKGMSRRATTELQKYLKSNPNGCVLSVSMTSMRSSVIVFPAEGAMDSVWNAMTASRRGQ